MKKFRYPMQSILEIKRKLEDQERSNYAAAQMRLNAENEKLSELSARREEYEERLRDTVGKRLVPAHIRRDQEAVEVMKLLIRQQTVQVRKAEQNVEAAVHRLKAAMIERKTQERLREKAFADYLGELEAEERKEIDERVSFQHGAVGAVPEMTE